MWRGSARLPWKKLYSCMGSCRHNPVGTNNSAHTRPTGDHIKYPRQATSHLTASHQDPISAPGGSLWESEVFQQASQDCPIVVGDGAAPLESVVDAPSRRELSTSSPISCPSLLRNTGFDCSVVGQFWTGCCDSCAVKGTGSPPRVASLAARASPMHLRIQFTLKDCKAAYHCN